MSAAPGREAGLAAEVERLHELVLDQGDALARLTVDVKALKLLLSASGDSEPADPKSDSEPADPRAARRERIAASGLLVLPGGAR